MLFLIDDFRQAWRGLRSSPGFLALSASVLALGLGATIFMYGVINTVMLKPPPFPDAGRLFSVFGTDPARNKNYGDIVYLDYLEMQDHQRSFESLAGYYSGTMILSADGQPERYTGGFVTHQFLTVLGVKPFLGRDFTAADDVPNAAPVALLAYDLWRTRFNSDADIIGRVVKIGSRPTTVVGVMPKGFTFPTAESMWTPIARDLSRDVRGDQTGTSLDVAVVGRLKADVTPSEAQEEFATISARLAEQYPRTNRGKTVRIVPIAEALVSDGRPLLFTMFCAVWLVLLIACANVASLVFVRANFRVYEASMRVALGARRPRLIVQMLTESVTIAFIGLLGGLVLAALGLNWIESTARALSEFPSPAWWRFSIDTRVAAFAFAAALVSGLLSGIVPAIRASRPDVMRILRDGGRTGTGLRLSKFTTAMVIVEVALSAALLTGAGLMTRSAFLSLQQDFGADVTPFMSARVGLPESAYPLPEQQSRFFEQMVADLQSRPGVIAATASTSMPGIGSPELLFAIDGQTYNTRSDYPSTDAVIVTPGFFSAFSTPLRQGRDFNSGDRYDTPHVVIVNEAFVSEYFPGTEPLGRRLQISPEKDGQQWATIIGVVPNINHSDQWTNGTFGPTLYRPVSQQPWRFLTVAIKTQGNPRAYGDALRKSARSLDPDLALYWLMTLEDYQVQTRFGLRLMSTIFVVFAGIAIILAGVGIYGVLAFATGQRNREIGVRRALGALDRQILRTVMRGALVQLAIGLALGALLAPMMGRMLGAGLQGLPADDPVVYTVVMTILVVAAIVASWLPAVRALRVQPATALRHE